MLNKSWLIDWLINSLTDIKNRGRQRSERQHKHEDKQNLVCAEKWLRLSKNSDVKS